MATHLTPAQQKVLSFIKDFVARHRFAPTAKEIAENFGIAVKNGFYYLDLLERKGYIRRRPHSPRRIEFVGEALPRFPVRVPVQADGCRQRRGHPPVLYVLRPRDADGEHRDDDDR